MGIPVITNSGVGDVAAIVQTCKSGIVINEFTDEGLETAVNEVINNINYDAVAIRKGATEFYALENAIEKYCRIYRSILG